MDAEVTRGKQNSSRGATFPRSSPSGEKWFYYTPREQLSSGAPSLVCSLSVLVRLLRLRALFAFKRNVKPPRARASDERLERQNDAGNRGRSLGGALARVNYWSKEGAISFRNARVLVMVARFEGPLTYTMDWINGPRIVVKYRIVRSADLFLRFVYYMANSLWTKPRT